MSAPPASPSTNFAAPMFFSGASQGLRSTFPSPPAGRTRPSGPPAPLPDSRAATWLFASLSWALAYAFPPASPFSSFMNSTTRMVRRGGGRSWAARRAASITMTAPAPSSIAPCARSHESRCAPSRTTSSGFSRPRTSATTFDDWTSGSVLHPSQSRTWTRAPFASRRCNRSASSVEMAAPATCGAPSAKSVAPVCGERKLIVARDRTRAATAPAFAASAGPCVRRSTKAPYPVSPEAVLIVWFKKTIFPLAFAPSACTSAMVCTSTTSPSTPSGGVPGLPPSAVTASFNAGTPPGRRRRALAKAACRRTDRRVVRGVLRVGDDPQGASLRRSLERLLHRSLLAHERRQALSAGGVAALDDAARGNGAETHAHGARGAAARRRRLSRRVPLPRGRLAGAEADAAIVALLDALLPARRPAPLRAGGRALPPDADPRGDGQPAARHLVPGFRPRRDLRHPRSRGRSARRPLRPPRRGRAHPLVARRVLRRRNGASALALRRVRGRGPGSPGVPRLRRGDAASFPCPLLRALGPCCGGAGVPQSGALPEGTGEKPPPGPPPRRLARVFCARLARPSRLPAAAQSAFPPDGRSRSHGPPRRSCARRGRRRRLRLGALAPRRGPRRVAGGRSDPGATELLLVLGGAGAVALRASGKAGRPPRPSRRLRLPRGAHPRRPALAPLDRAGTPVRAAPALFLAVVAGLYFSEVRPQIEDHIYRAIDGRPFHLPTYLPGDCPFYRATALSLLREKDLDLRDDMAWNVVRPQGQG